MKMMTRIASVSLFALALSAAACGGTTATDQQPATAQSALTTAPVGASTHGMVKVVGDALGEVPLRADQRTELEKLANDAEARHQTMAPARKDLVEAIAAQVEAGKIDRAALQPKIDAAAAAWQSVQDADRASFERVHAILDASQRAKLVDALQAHMQGEHHGRKAHGPGPDGKPGPDGARGPGANPEMHGPPGGPGGFLHMAQELNLTDAQKDQLKQAFHDKMQARMQANAGDAPGHDFRAEMKAHHEEHQKVMEAFKGDRFVMDEVAPKKDPKVMANKMSDGMLGMLETALPILTPEQRTIAAAKIREHATAKAGAPGPF